MRPRQSTSARFFHPACSLVVRSSSAVSDGDKLPVRAGSCCPPFRPLGDAPTGRHHSRPTSRTRRRASPPHRRRVGVGSSSTRRALATRSGPGDDRLMTPSHAEPPTADASQPARSIDYDEAVARHRWQAPAFYNIATDVCEKHPRERLAMIYERFDGHRAEVRWGALQDLSAQAAHALASAGVGRAMRGSVIG
jgi:hypothetical protein